MASLFWAGIARDLKEMMGENYKTSQKQMKLSDIINALRLFNEKANKLERLNFTKKIFKEKSGVHFSGKRLEDGKAEILVERFGPGEESTDAFLFTLRFFIRDNERSSFRNMAKLYTEKSVDPNLKNMFIDAREKINRFLNGYSPIRIIVNKEHQTRRQIFDVFMWGGLAHANPKKKAIYDKWTKYPIFPLLENEFIMTLVGLLNAIFFMRDINKKVLNELKKNDV